jgi:two-component system, NtrC family, sensor kinase
MKKALPAINEAERLQELLSLDILDTMPEPNYDELVELAADLLGTPISLVSLIDSDRQWFKARFGLSAEELPRDISFCGHTINRPEVFVVNNSDNDERFSDNPLVTGHPFVKFYAGVPLITSNGHAMGTMCVIDHKPRDISPKEIKILQTLARQVMSLIELRKALMENDQRLKEIKTLSESVAHQKDRLISLDKMELLAGLSSGLCHEINNPLTAVMLNADAMIKHFRKNNEENFLLKKLESIKRNAFRIEKIIKDLKLYTGRNDHPLKANKSLTEILNIAAARCGSLFKENNINFIINNPPPVWLYVDDAQITQVLCHLYTNAIDAIKEMEEKWIKQNFERSTRDDFVRLRIIDSGPSIGPEVINKMMQPFFSTKEVGKGTGLGLSISQGIIRNHGGELFYEQWGGHTSFVIDLPIYVESSRQ